LFSTLAEAEQSPPPGQAQPVPQGQQPALPNPGQFPGFGPMMSDPNWPTRVFTLRYVDIGNLQTLLSTFGVPMYSDRTLKAISVRAPQATLTAIEELIKRFDVPASAPKTIDLTAYLVLGSQGDTDSIPPAIKPVIDQLKSVMSFKSYRVVDTLLGRGSEGDVMSSSGMIAKLSESDPPGQPIYVNFQLRPRVQGDGTDQVIRLENLRLNVKVWVNGSYNDLTISTALDVKKGQQMVVGKAAFQDRALILILSARVVD